MTSASPNPLFEARNLEVTFPSAHGKTAVVKGVSLTVQRGETLGLVGESGSGKSMVCRSIIDLIPRGGELSAGGMFLDGQALHTMSKSDRAATRGRRIGLIPQDPLSSLNPVLKIKTQMVETIRQYHNVTRSAAYDQSVQMLANVNIQRPDLVMRQYPHELSGGMRQRIASCIALSAKPELLIADEPTTSLDVTIEKEFIQMLAGLQEELGFGLIFVTHDLALIASFADRICVMRNGSIVEEGSVDDVFCHPRHEYTRMLLSTVPEIDTKLDPESNSFEPELESHTTERRS